MLGDIVSCWTRIVSRMSTASFEYGFSVLSSADRVRRSSSATVGDRVVQERLVDADQLPAGLVRCRSRGRRQPAHELRTADSTSPRKSSQL